VEAYQEDMTTCRNLLANSQTGTGFARMINGLIKKTKILSSIFDNIPIAETKTKQPDRPASDSTHLEEWRSFSNIAIWWAGFRGVTC
jgi:hypothetical protein